jgi:hypothetical protein
MHKKLCIDAQFSVQNSGWFMVFNDHPVWINMKRTLIFRLAIYLEGTRPEQNHLRSA